ncbi:hypothetical protein EMIT0P74_60312 [Pseudomonas sp. IT-P74]
MRRPGNGWGLPACRKPRRTAPTWPNSKAAEEQNCRSELARDDLNGAAFNQRVRVVIASIASKLAPTEGGYAVRGLSRIATDVTALKKKS